MNVRPTLNSKQTEDRFNELYAELVEELDPHQRRGAPAGTLRGAFRQDPLVIKRRRPTEEMTCVHGGDWNCHQPVPDDLPATTVCQGGHPRGTCCSCCNLTAED